MEEAAQCLMTMPSLLLEPIFSFVPRICPIDWLFVTQKLAGAFISLGGGNSKIFWNFQPYPSGNDQI